MSREVDEIKSKIDIIDLMSGYIKLIPAGANHKAACPFHNEKTPSLMINRDKQIWRCFGCGEGGDIFTFLMKIEGLEFGEALKILAQKAGVQLSHINVKEESRKSRLMDICSLAAKYWHKILLESSQAQSVRDYVAGRGLSQETIEDFSVGYAVDSWDNLLNFLKKRGFSEQDIFLAGLTVKKDRGVGFYDRFRGRLMFPITDLSGKVVGFGGRALKDDGGAKYINTPQTDIYNKSFILYGLAQAKDEIKKQDQCVLVEGYMDVLPSHQMGIKNVVAISGTALTDDHVNLLKRYSNNVALALDMDLAGRQAALRSIDVALSAGMNVKVISLPQGKDPGECIKTNPDEWPSGIKKSQSVMDYYFDQILVDKDISQPQDKKIVIEYMIGQIDKLGSRIDQDYWIKKMSQKMSISEEVLREELKSKKGLANSVSYKPAARGLAVTKKERAVEAKDIRLFKKIMALCLSHPSLVSDVVNNLSPDVLINQVVATIYKDLLLLYNNDNDLFKNLKFSDTQTLDLFDLLNVTSKHSLIDLPEKPDDLLSEAFLLAQKDFADIDEPVAQDELRSLIKTLKGDYLAQQINILKNQLAEAEVGGLNEEVEEIYLKLSELIKQKG